MNCEEVQHAVQPPHGTSAAASPAIAACTSSSHAEKFPAASGVGSVMPRFFTDIERQEHLDTLISKAYCFLLYKYGFPPGGMMRKFSVRPTFTMKGREFRGLRGWAGKPLHPPLTDLPIAAYVLAASFDLISAIAGEDHDWAGDLWHAGTFAFVGGVAVSVFAALTGLWDAKNSSEAGTQARRTISAHATIMVTVTVLAIVDTIWRLNSYHTEPVTPTGLAVLSVVIAILVSLGATFGGTLVYDYGFNVETATDSPVWHKSEIDVMPGHHEEPIPAPDDSTLA